MSTQRHVRRLALARFVSLAGGEGTFVVGIWGRAVYEFSAGPAEVAPIMVALGVASMAGTLLAGQMIDRFDPRRVLLVGELATVPAALTLMLAGSVGELTALVGLWGFLHGVTTTASASFAPYVATGVDGLGRVNAALDAAGSTALVAGSALAAGVAAVAGLSAVFLVDAAGSVVGAALLAGVRVRRMNVERERVRFGELLEGFRFAAASPLLRFVVGVTFLQWVLFGVFSVFEPLFFRDVLGEGPAMLGLINTVFGAGLVGGAALFGRVGGSWASARGVTWLVVLTGAGAIAYTAVADLRMAAVGVALLGIAIGAAEPAGRTLVQSVTPDGLVGRVVGVTRVNEQVGELLPALLVPVVASGWDPQLALVGSGLLMATAGVGCLPLARRADRRRARRVEPGMLPT